MNSEKAIMKRPEEAIKAANKKKGRLYELSLSAGIVKYNRDDSVTIDDLLADADQLMYQAKKSKKKVANKNNNTILACDTCGTQLGPYEDQIGRKCDECKAEEASCGCSDE